MDSLQRRERYKQQVAKKFLQANQIEPSGNLDLFEQAKSEIVERYQIPVGGLVDITFGTYKCDTGERDGRILVECTFAVDEVDRRENDSFYIRI